MAIDSQAKRAGVLGIVQPDGSIDQADRQSISNVYPGVLAGEVERSPWKRRRLRYVASFRRRM